MPYRNIDSIIITELVLFSLIGFIIGFLAPTWYRDSMPRWEENRLESSNPFIVGSPIFEASKFYGRRDVIKRILQGLRSNHFYICGPRRSGKTSLIKAMARELEMLRAGNIIFHPIGVDLQTISERSLFAGLGNSLLDSLRYLYERIEVGAQAKQRIEILRNKYLKHVVDRDELSSLFYEVLEMTAGWSSERIILVFLIDEFEKMNEFQLDTREKFRSLFMSENVDDLKLIATGGLLEIWDRSSPFNFMKEIKLGPLTKEAARDLIVKTSEKVVTWEETALDFVLAQSGRQPFVIQQICSEIVDFTIRNHLRIVTEDTVKKASITDDPGGFKVSNVTV
jgi:hypothetical protein